jgi:hypothetical protein
VAGAFIAIIGRVSEGAMDAAMVDRLARRVARGAGRRSILRALGGAGLLGSAWAMADDAVAKRKKKSNKKNKKPNKKKPDCLSPRKDLQAAIDAAKPGSTLRLCAGRRVLTSTVVIDKDMTLRGDGAGKTILDGDGAVRVLRIGVIATVTLRDLTVTGGRADGPDADDKRGGGIVNEGQLTLLAARVTGSSADLGGGISSNNVLTLGAGSVVGGEAEDTANSASIGGGGIFIDENGTLTMKSGSRVVGNVTPNDGGGIASFGDVTLEANSRVTGNEAGDAGGGINNSGTLTLEDGSVVGGDSPGLGNVGGAGGGISGSGTTTLKSGSRVSGNTATFDGGGIFNVGTLTLEATSRVSGNQAPENKTSGIFNTDPGAVTLEFGALVCENVPLSLQCSLTGGITGICPNPGGLTCG